VAARISRELAATGLDARSGNRRTLIVTDGGGGYIGCSGAPSAAAAAAHHCTDETQYRYLATTGSSGRRRFQLRPPLSSEND